MRFGEALCITSLSGLANWITRERCQEQVNLIFRPREFAPVGAEPTTLRLPFARSVLLVQLIAERSRPSMIFESDGNRPGEVCLRSSLVFVAV